MLPPHRSATTRVPSACATFPTLLLFHLPSTRCSCRPLPFLPSSPPSSAPLPRQNSRVAAVATNLACLFVNPVRPMSVYWEKQVSSLCATHALNSLLQGCYFTEDNMSETAIQLREEEGSCRAPRTAPNVCPFVLSIAQPASCPLCSSLTPTNPVHRQSPAFPLAQRTSRAKPGKIRPHSYR